jgi:Ni/Co efflux regulator RcnB
MEGFWVGVSAPRREGHDASFQVRISLKRSLQADTLRRFRSCRIERRTTISVQSHHWTEIFLMKRVFLATITALALVPTAIGAQDRQRQPDQQRGQTERGRARQQRPRETAQPPRPAQQSMPLQRPSGAQHPPRGALSPPSSAAANLQGRAPAARRGPGELSSDRSPPNGALQHAQPRTPPAYHPPVPQTGRLRPQHATPFRYPRGYSYRGWSIGSLLPRVFLGSGYYFDGYSAFGVGAPPRGFRWVRYGPDLVLVNVRTGRITRVVRGAFY